MLRLAFMGTPDFAVPVLAELIAAGHDIAAVYSQPARPAGRGHKPQASAVAAFAQAQSCEVRTPESLKTEEVQADFAALGLDAAVVAAYGLILPRAILAAPRLGCLNVHASLLPRWRGAAPIQRAIMAGDAESGVTIMQMEAGLDTGPILLVERAAIGPRMNAGMLHDRLALIGASLMVRALAALERGTLTAVAQPETGVTYAAKITKEEARLDWRQPALTLDRKIRALSPAPGAWFELADTRVRVLEAVPAAGEGAPGTVLDNALTIACGGGALSLERVQRAGKAPVAAADFRRGVTIAAGSRLP